MQGYSPWNRFRYLAPHPGPSFRGEARRDAGTARPRTFTRLEGEVLMAATKLDGAGAQKMKTLEEALITLQTMHGMVERAAIEVKAQKSIGVIPQQIKRLAVPLQGQ